MIESFIRCHWQATRGTGDSTEPEFSDKSMPIFYPKVRCTFSVGGSREDACFRSSVVISYILGALCVCFFLR